MITQKQIDLEAMIQNPSSDSNEYNHGHQIGFNDGAKWMQEQPMRWVSVDERLPEVDQAVAFIVKSDSYLNGKILGGKYLGFRFGFHEFCIPGMGLAASHWMPLPSPPTTE